MEKELKLAPKLRAALGASIPVAQQHRDVVGASVGHRDRASGGTRLGLAIARRAVELHKGKLQARNANPGLLVEMELPVAA